MVGALLVRGSTEIAHGWHRRFGSPHAEVEAIAAAKAAGKDTRGATLYVTLEPCCHHAKTPPCTKAIIAAGIARVVAAMPDPDASVSGRGIAALRSAGLRVDVGICQDQARKLLAAYRKLRSTGRPWVICKWAQTLDGFLARPAEQGRWVSGREAMAHVHRLRGLSDGVLVGIGTVLADDPLLTSRSGSQKQPARVVLDSNLRTPADSQLAETTELSPVIVATTAPGIGRDPAGAEELRSKGVELLELPADRNGRVNLPALLDELGKRQWTYLLVEGGSAVLASFVETRLADELLAFVSSWPAGPGDQPLPRFDIAGLRSRLPLPQPEARQLGPDQLLRFVLTD